MSSSSAAGALSSGFGSASAVDAKAAPIVSPGKARIPLTSSYRMQPNAKMSLRASAGLPFNCSGAMYPGVPAMAIVCVAAVAPSTDFSASLAKPKSSTFTEPFSVTRMLPGLRSRCTIPAACAAASASAIWMPYSISSFTGYGPFSGAP